jgi:hypothetical protein
MLVNLLTWNRPSQIRASEQNIKERAHKVTLGDHMYKLVLVIN